MKNILAIAAFVIISSASIAQKAIGLQLYSFRNEFAKDVPGTLQKISAMGIRLVEGGSTYGMTEQAFRQLLVKNKLTVISFGADYKELESSPQGVAAKAKASGAKYVMCAWIPHNGNNFTIDDADKAIAVFNNAGKILKANGLSFCYHAHGYEFRPFKNATLFDYMADKLNAAYVNFEMDVYWIKHPGQEPVALLKKYPYRFPLMHLKDRKPGTAGNQNGESDVETNVVLGTGDVGITPIMKVAGKYGVKYFFIEDESSRSMEQVPKSLKYLKGLK
jgi:sugar phosphate isomerase/epimerase